MPYSFRVTMRLPLRFAVVTTLVAGTACATGPRDSIAGTWRGAFYPGPQALSTSPCYPFQLVLSQSGTHISGKWTEFGCTPTTGDSIVGQGTDVNGSNVNRSIRMAIGSDSLVGELNAAGDSITGSLVLYSGDIVASYPMGGTLTRQ